MAQQTVTQSFPAVSDDATHVQRALAAMRALSAQLCRSTSSALSNCAEQFCATTPGARDAVQDAYVSAFENLASYCGEATLADMAVPHYLIEVS